MAIRESAATLERESDVSLESEEIATFREAVLAGQWEDVETLMETITRQQLSSEVRVILYVKAGSF